MKCGTRLHRSVEPNGRKNGNWKQALIFIGIGTELVLFTVIGALVGAWLDGKWGSSPWALIAGLTLGATAGFIHFFRVAKRFF